jgi:lysophospholipase L1-like esterase
MTLAWHSYVAIGDSFSEGMDDPYPDGSFRGWADRVAHALAAQHPGFSYANLAIRGRKMGQILAEQVPVAEVMNADLASLTGGTNDLLRPRVDLDRVESQFEEAGGRLRSTGADVLLFEGGVRSFPVPGLTGRAARAAATVERVAREYDCILVPLVPDVFRHPEMWADDRLHLSSLGHERVAGAVLEVLGSGDSAWREPLPPHSGPGGSSATRAIGLARRATREARWGATHLAPWIGRRLTGRSSGDGRAPKRSALTPVVAPD